jgi:hypothetical protein
MLCVLSVGLSGLLVFGVGIFLTLPLAVAASVYAYEDIFGKIDPATLALAEPSGTPQGGGTTGSLASPAVPAEGAAPPAATAPTPGPSIEPGGASTAGKAPDA